MRLFLAVVGMAALALGLIANSANQRRTPTTWERQVATWGIRTGVLLLTLLLVLAFYP